MLNISTSSQATSSTLNHASTMAAKALGVRPATGPVKSLQLAAAAAKKVSLIAVEWMRTFDMRVFSNVACAMFRNKMQLVARRP